MYEKTLGITIIILIVLGFIYAITKATKSTKDDKIGSFIKRFLDAFLDILEKIVPFYKRNK